MTKFFAVVRRPGFRGHEMTILSAHSTQKAAEKAASRHRYQRGWETVDPAHAVRIDQKYAPRGCVKGGTLWDDTHGRLAWSSC